MGLSGITATGPPVMPKWLFFLRIAILVFTFGSFIAACVNVAALNGWTSYYSSSGPGGFTIFDAIFTWIVIGSMLVLEWRFHQFYVRLAYLVLLPLCAIFWLSAWAWSASVASAFRGYYSGFGDDDWDRYAASIAACAALGAFTWVAIIVLTIFYIMACLRDGGEDQPTTYQTEMAVPKQEPVNTAVQQPADPNQYPQQGYYSPEQQQQQQQSPYPPQETPQYPQQQQPPPQQYPPQQQH
jgi:hypothetical protein